MDTAVGFRAGGRSAAQTEQPPTFRGAVVVGGVISTDLSGDLVPAWPRPLEVGQSRACSSAAVGHSRRDRRIVPALSACSTLPSAVPAVMKQQTAVIAIPEEWILLLSGVQRRVIRLSIDLHVARRLALRRLTRIRADQIGRA